MRSVFAAAFVLLAALPARADDLRIPLDEDFANFEVMWNKNEHSSTVYWNVVDYNGRLVMDRVLATFHGGERCAVTEAEVSP